MSIRQELLKILRVIFGSALSGLVAGLAILCVGFLFGNVYNNTKLLTSYIFIFTLLGIFLLIGDYTMMVWDKIKHHRK